jgi:uncharacterized protein with HEPN domain
LQRDPRAYLWDAREAADAIATFTIGHDQATYASDELVHSAVERKFEIIGEALNSLSRNAPDIAVRISDLPKIIAFRNILIHGYATLDHGRVWAITRRELLALRKDLQLLLTELGELI